MGEQLLPRRVFADVGGAEQQRANDFRALRRVAQRLIEDVARAVRLGGGGSGCPGRSRRVRLLLRQCADDEHEQRSQSEIADYDVACPAPMVAPFGLGEGGIDALPRRSGHGQWWTLVGWQLAKQRDPAWRVGMRCT